MTQPALRWTTRFGFGIALGLIPELVIWAASGRIHFLERWVILGVLAAALTAMLRGHRWLGGGLLAGQLAFIGYLMLGGL